MTLQSVTIKASPWKVGNLAQLKKDEKLHLPDLQRGFVWSPERVRALLDSLYRRYPVGALLLWKPTWDTGDAPFLTRPWDLAPPDPSTGLGAQEKQAKVQPGSYFVLDGQQRLTSLFRVIFKSRLRESTTADPQLMVALSPEPEWADDPFHLVTRQLDSQLRSGLLVPAEVLFEGMRGNDKRSESLAIQNALKEWITLESPLFFEALDRANEIRNAVLGAEIVAYEIDADAEDDNVIEIFARLNQQGVRLRPGDLAAARLTGIMKGFREKAHQALAVPELAGFAADEGTEEHPRSGAFVDTDLLVRTALFLSTGMLRYRDLEKKRGLDAEYSKIESQWDPACAGLTYAAAMYRKAGVPDGAWLPYRYLLLAPAVAHARGHQVGATTWLGWAVAASLWGHYGASAESRAQADAKLAAEGKTLGLFDALKSHARRAESLVPEESDFIHSVPLESGVMLALLIYLSKTHARSFPSGRLLSDQAEPIEAFPLFSRAHLDRFTWRDSSNAPDRLGNMTLLYRSDADQLRGRLPSEYLAKCDPDHLALHGIPVEKKPWELARYAELCLHHEKAMARAVIDLLRSYGVP